MNARIRVRLFRWLRTFQVILVLILGLFNYHDAYSQFSHTDADFVIGGTMNYFRGEGTDLIRATLVDNVREQPRTGVQVGIFMQPRFDNNLFIELGAHYYEKGYKFQHEIPLLNAIVGQDLDININYLLIDFNGGYKIGGDDFSIDLFGGISGGKAISAKLKYEHYGVDIPPDNTLADFVADPATNDINLLDDKGTYYDAGVQAGFTLRIWRIALRAQYYYGLVKINADEGVLNSGPSIALGYQFQHYYGY